MRPTIEVEHQQIDTHRKKKTDSQSNRFERINTASISITMRRRDGQKKEEDIHRRKKMTHNRRRLLATKAAPAVIEIVGQGKQTGRPQKKNKYGIQI